MSSISKLFCCISGVFPSNRSLRLMVPFDSHDSYRLIGRIMMCANRPVPLWIVSSASGSTDEPVRINCDGTPRLSTSLRMESQMGGNACHSSISRGVAPSNNVFGPISIICILCFSTDASPRSSTLRASCLAVVVLPHHLGPSIRTAPFPRTLRSRILSAIRRLYSAISFVCGCKGMIFISFGQIF